MLNVIIYIGYQSRALNCDLRDSSNTGIGGSETSAINLANHLTMYKLANVFLVGNVIEQKQSDYDFHIYETSNFLNQVKNGNIINDFDILIGVNYIHYLNVFDSVVNFKSSIFWMHNFEPFYGYMGGYINKQQSDRLFASQKMSAVVCVSEYQANRVKKQFPICENKVVVIPNGIDTNILLETQTRKNYERLHFIYSSDPSRGLKEVIDMWEQVVEAHPNAMLHIAYPSYNSSCNDIVHNLVNGTLPKTLRDTVNVHGSLTKPQLYDVMSQCSFWLYPSTYEETFCITALEAAWFKLIPLCTDAGNLRDLFNNLNPNAALADHTHNFQQIKDHILKSIDEYTKGIWQSNTKQPSSMVTQEQIELRKQLQDQHQQASLFSWHSVVHKWNDLITSPTVEGLKLNTYVISLKEITPELHIEYKNRLIDAGFPDDMHLNIIPAVNGSLVDEEYLNAYQFKLYPNWKIQSDNKWYSRDMLPGEIGCAISHYIAWNMIVERHNKYALILEEDFLPTGTRLTDETLSDLPINWDMLYLGCNHLRPKKGDVGDGSKIIINDACYNLHAYMLSDRGAKKLLDQQFNKMLMPVDEFIQCTYTKHERPDLHFIWNDSFCYSVANDIFVQYPGTPEKSQTENLELLQQLVESKQQEKDVIMNVKTQNEINILDYFDYHDQWIKKYLSPGAADLDFNLAIDEPISNVFCWKLFTPQFCTDMIKHAEQVSTWTKDRHYFFPTTDMLLEQIQFNEIYNDILQKYVEPAMKYLYQLDGNPWNNLERENFIARYTTEDQPQLKIHHDNSDISVLINLSEPDVDFTGGGTYFPKYKSLYRPSKGSISLHPGNITHKHGARAVLDGKRYIIVSFIRRA